jgi:RNA polymerase sigma-70 factor (sigma-E family)
VDRGAAMADPDATFEAFVRLRSAALFRFSVVLTGDVGSAEDLLQSVLEKVYGRFAADHAPDNPEAYTRTALVNAARHFWRRRGSSREVLVAELPEGLTAEATGDVLLRGALLQVLRTLPVRQRAVVALRYFDDYSESEVALILGCNVGTVKSHAHRALRKLRADPRLASYLETVKEA